MKSALNANFILLQESQVRTVTIKHFEQTTFEEVFGIVLVSSILILFLVALFLLIRKPRKIVDETIEITLSVQIIATLWWIIGILSTIFGVYLFLPAFLFRIILGPYFFLAFSLVATFLVGLGVVCFFIGSGFRKLDRSAWIGSVILSSAIAIASIYPVVLLLQMLQEFIHTQENFFGFQLLALITSVIILLYSFVVRDQFLQREKD
ncbi:MAG: hypothetical protein ACFE9L_13120 [Candidatus Hodarchaeota archaeon]